MSRSPSARWMSVITISICLSACGQSQPVPDTGATAEAFSNTAGDADAERKEAIETVSRLTRQGALKVTLQIKYMGTNHRFEKCSDLDTEYARSGLTANGCKLRADGTFWKSVTSEEERCCRTKLMAVPPDVAWTAFKSRDDGTWHVKGDFSLDGTPHHAEFMVDGPTVTATIVS